MTVQAKGWVPCTLADVVTLKTGPFGSAVHQSDYVNGGTPLINPTHIKSGTLVPDFSVTVTPAKLTELNEYKLVEGDVVMGRRGEMGRCAVAPKTAEGWLCGTGSVIARPTKAITPHFLQRFLSSPETVRALNGDSVGSTMVNLNQKILLSLSIDLPPLAEQKRIADKLDTVLTRVDAVKARLARVAPLLKRFRQSVLAAAVSGRLTTETSLSESSNWQSVILGNLIEDGPKNGLYKPSSAYGGGIRILRIDSFYDGKVSDWATLRRLSIDSNELKQFGLKNGDVVINRVNSIEYLGKCALIEGLQGECVFESNMMRFRLAPELADPHFIRTWLCSEDARTQIVGKAKHAVNQASINQSDVCGLKLQLPPLPEQTEIVRRVETLFAFADRLEARLAQAQTAATRLTPALLAKAFRGELVPQDPNDEPAAELLRRLAQAPATASPRKGRKAAGTAV